MNSKWLITGGCGFLGSNIADEALSAGNDVTIIDNLSRIGSDLNLQWLRTQHGHDWQFANADVRDPDAIATVVSEVRPDVVVHLAGQVAMTTSLGAPRHDFEVNAVGSFNVLEAVRKYYPEAIVLYSSTNKVYGDLESVHFAERATRYEAVDYPQGFDETLPLDFATPYGCSKGAADQYMRDYARSFGLRTIVFRHSSMYGGRQYATSDQGWVGWFCREALRQAKGDPSPIVVSGNGKQVRDILHAADVRRLYTMAVEHADRARGQAFNIGGGMERSLSIVELLRSCEARVGTPLKIAHKAARASDQKVFVACTHRSREVLDWSPRISVEDGLLESINWMKDTVYA